MNPKQELLWGLWVGSKPSKPQTLNPKPFTSPLQASTKVSGAEAADRGGPAASMSQGMKGTALAVWGTLKRCWGLELRKFRP